MKVELRDIHKHYGAVRANDGVSLTLDPGTIHGILGENGAGKSTLMKVLAGYTARTRGEILVDGETVDGGTPRETARLGIAMLYQEPMDYPQFSVIENFMTGLSRGLSRRETFFRQQLDSLSRRFRFSLDPDRPARDLTPGERQQLELLRLIARGIEVLILDEPTTGISGEQQEALFGALRALAAEGKTVVLVSHKLRDAEALCDRVTVLRNGRVTGTVEKPFSQDRILELMFGALPEPAPRRDVSPGEEVLSVEGLWGTGGRAGLEPVSLRFCRRETVALAGLEGSGQELFLRMAGGLVRPGGGVIRLFGREARGGDTRLFRKNGVTFLPASRLEEGLVPGLTIGEHFALLEDRGGFFVHRRESLRRSRERIRRFRILGSPETTVENLSGGNQQRLLLSFLSKRSKILLLEHPTRGLDVDSARWTWRRLEDARHEGATILFISSDMDEILSAAGRVLVFFNGRVVLDKRRDETDGAEIGEAMVGKAGASAAGSGNEGAAG